MKKQIARAIKPVLESLENRQMLAIVEGGQVGFYRNSSNQVIKIDVEGGGALAFVGSSTNSTGGAQLNDISMTIMDRVTGQVIRENLGGIGGRDGIGPIYEVLNTTPPFVDSLMRSTSIGGLNGFYNFFGPTDAIEFQALASNTLGRTYAINRRVEGFGAADDNPAYDVVGVNNNNGRVEVLDSIAPTILSTLQTENPGIEAGDLGDLIGADFDPSDPDMLYLALVVNWPFGGGTNVTDKEVPVMMTYNIRTQAMTFVNRFGANSATDAFEIADFTFLSATQIAFFGSVKRGDNEAFEGLFITDKARPGPDNRQQLFLGVGDQTEAVTNIAAIESIDGTFILAVDDSQQILRINLDTDGTVLDTVVQGSTLDPDQPADATVKRGNAISDLAYNPKLVDNNGFQLGKRGVLLGTDTGTDELVGLDARQRFTNSDIYAVYDTEATTDTNLSITVITPSSDNNLSFEERLFEGVSNPYGASAGQIATFMTDPGQDSPQLVALGNGGVFIGGRSLNADEQLVIPSLQLSSDRDPDTGDYVGTLPGTTLPPIVNPGIYISGAIRGLFIAGTITGRINIGDSVDRFYAGNIVTGDVAFGTSNLTDNFFVGGDLRNLYVRGGIGKLAGSPNAFDPGTDIAVGGRVMQIKAGLEFRGGLDVVGKYNTISNRDNLPEIESVVNPAGTNVVDAFDAFQIANQAFNRNDNFATPQIIGSILDKRGRNGKVTIDGSLNNGTAVNDPIDTYGLPLLAGEGATVQLISALVSNDTNLQIYDPDGRLYHTDRSNQNGTRETRSFESDMLSYDLPVNFTADKPGLWRIQVRVTSPVLTNLTRPYQLNISQLGNVALGGLASSASIVLSNPDVGVRVRNGDLGAILTGTAATDELYGAQLTLLGSGRESVPVNPIIAQRGSIRAIEAANISHLEAGGISGFPNILASGNLGLIHADDRLYMNVSESAVNLSTNGKPSKNFVVGGNIQVVESGGNFTGVLATNGSIGVIRAATIDINVNFEASYFQINADGRGNDELGLIDSAGGIGNFASGGPALSAGNGSNIKYIRAGGPIFRDRFFGFGSILRQHATNTSLTVTDDTGAEISIKPITGTFTTPLDTTTGGNGNDTTGGNGNDTTGGTGNDTITGGGLPDPFGGGGTVGAGSGTSGLTDPFGSGGTGGLAGLPDPFGSDIPVITDPNAPGAGVPDDSQVLGELELDTYAVRSGGFIVVNVESTTGVSIATNRKGGGGVADISRIQTGIRGTPLTVDADGNLVAVPTVIDPAQPQAEQLANANRFLDVILVGNSRVNAFVITGSTTGAAGAQYTRIDNFTDGEIVNLNAQSVGVLTGEWLGVARTSAGTKLDGFNDVADGRFNGVANLYPFNQAKNMIFVTTASTIGARGPLGNVSISNRVQNFIANAGNKNVKGVLEGIVAPVMVYGGNGTIDRVDIGEGLTYSGSGETAFSGIYSTDEIGTISNINGNGDLRGDVIARNYIDRINITGNGSIIDSDIYVVEVGADARALIDGPTPATGFQVALERINVIPTISVINDTPTSPFGLGKITISGAGGMMNSRIFGYNIGKVTANRGSFGILTSDFLSETGGSMGGISADGLGIRYVTYRGGSYIGDVVATGAGKLRSTEEFSRSVRSSESSAFDPSTGNSLTASNDLHRFLSTTKSTPSVSGVTNDGIIEDSLIEANRQIRLVKAFTIRVVRNPLEARPRDETYPMQINTGGELTQVTTARSIEGLRAVSGTTGNIDSGNDIKNFQLQTTGFVNRVSASRNILGSANLNLIGSASINQINVGGNMGGTAYVAKGIRSLIVGGDFSSARTQGGVYTAASINQVLISGDVNNGSLLQAKNVIKQLVIGGSVESGSQVVAKSISSKRIKGSVDGIVT